MKKFRRVSFALMLVLALGLVLTACGGSEQAADTETTETVDKYGGTFVGPLLSDPKTFNPLLAQDTGSSRIVTFVFDSLVELDGVTTEIIPSLAESWESSEDGLVWTLHLRDDIKWSDGEPFTADDVIFTSEVIYDESIPTSTRDSLQVAGKPIKMEKADDYTVTMTLPEPFAPFLGQLTNFDVMPKHKLYDIWKEGKFAETMGVNAAPKDIVGTGPFIISDYKAGERVVMKKNPHYWGTDDEGNQLPYIDQWVRVVNESTETQLLRFENGELDYVQIDNVDYERMKAGAEAGGYKVVNGGPGFGQDQIIFNMNPRNPNLEEEPWKYEWFNNLNFRRAVAYAVDKDTIIDQVLAGLGQPLWSPISLPNKQFLKDDVKKYPYDLERAKAELKKGGFDWNEAGELIDADGRVVEFTMVTNAGNKEREGTLNIIASDLNKLGMNVHASPIDFNKIVSQLMDEWDFDVIYLGLTGGNEPHDGVNVWKSDGTLHMWNPRQEEPATEWEARVDELFDVGARVSEIEKRREYYNEWQDIIAEQLPIVYTVTKEQIFLVNDRVKNAKPTAFAKTQIKEVMWNVTEIYLAE